jgi:hypothetical protein
MLLAHLAWTRNSQSESWSIGVLEYCQELGACYNKTCGLFSFLPILSYSNTPLLQYSTTPLLHYSITPLNSLNQSIKIDHMLIVCLLFTCEQLSFRKSDHAGFVFGHQTPP